MTTEDHVRSIAGRMAGFVRNIVLGAMLTAAAIVLHFWNDWRAAQSAAGLTSTAAGVRTVDPSRVDRANDGRLIHFTTTLTARGGLIDPLFGISANVLRLRRTVEMYQWDEATDTSERRSFAQRVHRMAVWDRKHIDTRRFRRSEGRVNPPMPLPELVLTASPIMAGAYEIPPELLDRIGHFDKLPLSEAVTRPATRPATTQPATAGAGPAGGPVATTKPAATRPGTTVDLSEFKVVDGQYLYRGADPANPRVGDVRVSFDVVKPGVYTILAMQVPGTNKVAPGFSKANNQPVFGILPGTHPPEAIHREPGSPNTPLYWILRGAGLLGAWIGLALVMGSLRWIAGFIPFVRSIAALGTVTGGLILAVAVSAAVVGLAWLPYQPVVGGALIAGAVVVIFLARAAGAVVRRAQGADERGAQ